MTSLRWELEPLPRRMRGLPVHRGYPVPWFVEWVQDGELGGYSVFRVKDGWLFNIGEPLSVTWWAEGRRAARAEIQASIDSGLPTLRELAEQDGHHAVRQLERMVDQAMEHVA